ncbi:hypothetical protein AB0E88_30735 [Streptomyces sp. NPDC028635]|uniref:hypothetical protein n=1 Tax=Streptomyces sp. NPDC028635 TaxID=3154800 RepID=UPI0033E47FBD
MKRRLAGVLTVAALTLSGAAVAAGPATAAPASAKAFSCKLVWHDKNTAGVKCTGGTFIAAAKCKNGRVAQGAAAASGTTSYAYCTSYGSSLRTPVQAWGIKV